MWTLNGAKNLEILKCKTRKKYSIQQQVSSTWNSPVASSTRPLKITRFFFALARFFAEKETKQRAKREEMKAKKCQWIFSFNVFNGLKSNNFMSIYYVCVFLGGLLPYFFGMHISLNAVSVNFWIGLFVHEWIKILCMRNAQILCFNLQT